MSGANLSGYDLAVVLLDAADLIGADPTSLLWADTNCPDGTNSDAQTLPTCFDHLNGAVPPAGC